jgi:hypothetical protein
MAVTHIRGQRNGRVQMSGDDKKTTSETAVPFFQNDDFSQVAVAAAHAQRQRWHRNTALYMNNQPPLPPLAVMSGKVRYVDFGFTSTREYWMEVAEPAYDKFIKDESRGNAIMAFLALSPLPDWLWHEQHPGEDTRNNKDYEIFRQQLFASCPELAWLRDVADAGKHRGLGRANLQVREAAKTWPRNTQPLTIVLDSGTEHDISDVLSRVMQYFRTVHFPH